MNASVRPQTKLAAALVAAGVATAGSVVAVPEQRALPVASIDVANASLITDGLFGLGQAVAAAVNGVRVPEQAVRFLPFNALVAIGAAIQNPQLAPNVLSYLVQAYVNPALPTGDPNVYASWFRADTVLPIAQLLPFPLGPSATEPGLVLDVTNAITNAINGFANNFPSAAVGAQAAKDFLGTNPIGQLIYSLGNALLIQSNVTWNIADYVGFLPYNLEVTFEAALRNPDQIPGLVSNFAYTLLDPQTGLLGGIINSVYLPFSTLPTPIGEWGQPNSIALSIKTAIVDGVNQWLQAVLPAPVAPVPFPTVVPTPAQSPADPAALPSATLTAQSVALKTAVDETAAATTDATGTAETPAAETPATETPAAEKPATETPATETPAAETPAAETPATETPAAPTEDATTGSTTGDTVSGATKAGAAPTNSSTTGSTSGATKTAARAEGSPKAGASTSGAAKAGAPKAGAPKAGAPKAGAPKANAGTSGAGAKGDSE